MTQIRQVCLLSGCELLMSWKSKGTPPPRYKAFLRVNHFLIRSNKKGGDFHDMYCISTCDMPGLKESLQQLAKESLGIYFFPLHDIQVTDFIQKRQGVLFLGMTIYSRWWFQTCFFHPYLGPGSNLSISPPVRWGLLDFMSVSSPSPPPPSPSPSPPRPPPRRTSTTILWVQCGMPDLNHDLVSSVWRAGPQPRSCEFSVACRTPTASPWVQCGVPDPNREPVSSVWRAGPQPRSREFSVACRTSTAILWVQCGVPDLK